MYIKSFEDIRNAHTLSPDYLGTRKNDWSIWGEITEDYYTWVNAFCAKKGSNWVVGDFENVVYASSEKAYNDFIKKFPPENWDYDDI